MSSRIPAPESDSNLTESARSIVAKDSMESVELGDNLKLNTERDRIRQNEEKKLEEESEEYYEEEEHETTWADSIKYLGEQLLYGIDFLGEVFAEFFGLTQSRYQHVIDAYNRRQRWEAEERKQQERAKERYLQDQAHAMEEMRAKQYEMKQDIQNERGIDRENISLDMNRIARNAEDGLAYGNEKKEEEREARQSDDSLEFPMPPEDAATPVEDQ